MKLRVSKFFSLFFQSANIFHVHWQNPKSVFGTKIIATGDLLLVNLAFGQLLVSHESLVIGPSLLTGQLLCSGAADFGRDMCFW